MCWREQENLIVFPRCFKFRMWPSNQDFFFHLCGEMKQRAAAASQSSTLRLLHSHKIHYYRILWRLSVHLLQVSLIGEMAADGCTLILEPLIFQAQDSHSSFSSIRQMEQSHLGRRKGNGPLWCRDKLCSHIWGVDITDCWPSRVGALKYFFLIFLNLFITITSEPWV